MLRYIANRLLWMIIVLWCAGTVTFIMMHATPGGPWAAMARPGGATGDMIGEPIDHARRPSFEAKYGLDKPLIVQYLRFWCNAIRLDFGSSFFYHNDSVAELIMYGLPYSAAIGGSAFLLAGLLGVGAGGVAALRQGGWIDYVIRILTTVGYAIPGFVVGNFVLAVFATRLGWVPVLWTDWRNLILPSVVLALSPAGFLARLTRASILEVMRDDYVRTARSKGLANRIVQFRHVARNALIPVSSMPGASVAALITGGIIVENVFGIPGMGYLFVYGVNARDYPVIMGCTLLYVTFVVLGNLLADLSCGVLDPRIRGI